jgi:hypothetical protein
MCLVSDNHHCVERNMILIAFRELHIVHTHDGSAPAYHKGQGEEHMRERRPNVQSTLPTLSGITKQHDQGILLQRLLERVLGRVLLNHVSNRLGQMSPLCPSTRTCLNNFSISKTGVKEQSCYEIRTAYRTEDL